MNEFLKILQASLKAIINSEFFLKETTRLGQEINERGLKQYKEKIKAILLSKSPAAVEE